MLISRKQSNLMKGIAMLMICLHNLLHQNSIFKECEFAFYPERVMQLSSIPLTPWHIVEAFFSFWGWYGVPIFIFFSGYGLVCKHEILAKNLTPRAYIYHNYLKLIILLLPGYLFYFFRWISLPAIILFIGFGIASIFENKIRQMYIWQMICHNYLKFFLLLIPFYLLLLCASNEFDSIKIMFYHVTLLVNLIEPKCISPGVYWYFGLTLQLYLVYLLFYYYQSPILPVFASTLSLIIGVILACLPPSSFHEYLRHNFLLWLPIFILGIAVGRYGEKNIYIRTIISRRWLSLTTFTLLWIISSLYRPLWVFSPIFFIILIYLISVASSVISSAHIQSKIFTLIHLPIVRVLSYIGTISSGLFVCHPIIRDYFSPNLTEGWSLFLTLFLYLLFCIIIAIFYTFIYKKITILIGI